MAQRGYLIAGKVNVKNPVKIDGKKYETTEKLAEAISKDEELNGKTCVCKLNKDGKLDWIKRFNKSILYQMNVETPKHDGEGTYKADYIAGISWPINIKLEANPAKFTVITKKTGNEKMDVDNGDTDMFVELKVWDELLEKAKVDFAVPEGGRVPRIWFIARKGIYNGRINYTLVDYGVIPESEYVQ